MNYQVYYLIAINLIGIIGMIVFWMMRNLELSYKLRMKKNRYDKIIEYLKKQVDQTEIGSLFLQSGLKITPIQYQVARYVLFLVWITMLHIVYQMKGGTYPFKYMLVVIILFFLLSPTPYIFGKRTPFRFVFDLMILSYRAKKNVEILRAISQLKNIAIARKKNPPGSDFILEQIRKFTVTTRPIFNRMIALWSMGKREQACDYLESAIGTKEASELANILKKLDDLYPIELNNQLILLQETIKKERETRKLKSNENKSNFIYVIVITTNMVIMINFIVVVYYLETLHQLKFLY